MVQSFQWSFGATPIRSCHWAVECIQFVKTILVNYNEPNSFPSDYDFRSWFILDLTTLPICETRWQSFYSSFQPYREFFEAVLSRSYLSLRSSCFCWLRGSCAFLEYKKTSQLCWASCVLLSCNITKRVPCCWKSNRTFKE